MTDEVRQVSPWALMFVDDTVIMHERKKQVEGNLERCRNALQRRRMKASHCNTEYKCVNETRGTVRMQGGRSSNI